MKIAIIGAMEEEITPFKERFLISETEVIAEKQFFLGTTTKHCKIILLQSGVGKVNAAIGTALLIHKYNPDYVFNVGSIGACSPAFSIGDIVVSTAVRYHDVDLTAFGYEYGQMSKMPATFIPDKTLVNLAETCAQNLPQIQIKKALIVSGDTFLTSCEKVNFIKEQFSEICAAEMEAGAIAQTCHLFNIPFVIIRSVSDIVGFDNKTVHEQSLDLASNNVAMIVLEIIKHLS